MKKNFLITFTIIFFIAIAIYGQETKLDSFQSSSSSSEHSVFSIPYDLKLSEPNDFSGGLFSTAISSGDFNGDGYPDVVVGEYYRNNQTGRVNVFLGGPTIDETPDLIISGNQFEENFGYSISLGGDINNDGYDD
ncbi:MAG: FG-GAP repeat protein, partial [Ignavibacteriales bacterium]|nr:FG-GAP repeat protein [Ignavibacteriales bacterium]